MTTTQNSQTCSECGSPATVLDLHAYGPGKGQSLCTPCFISNNRLDNEQIATAVLGHPASVVVVGDEARCTNCDAYVMAEGGLTVPWSNEPGYVS